VLTPEQLKKWQAGPIGEGEEAEDGEDGEG